MNITSKGIFLSFTIAQSLAVSRFVMHDRHLQKRCCPLDKKLCFFTKFEIDKYIIHSTLLATTIVRSIRQYLLSLCFSPYKAD